MNNERLTYVDFQEHLIFQIAVLAQADFHYPFYVKDAAAQIDGRFPDSWVETTTAKLEKSRFLAVASAPDDELDELVESSKSFVERFRDAQARKGTSRTQYVLTEAGLVAAEQASQYLGRSLWEEMDQFEADGGRENVRETGRVVTLDRSSPAYVEVESEVRDTIRRIRSDNELMATPEGSQRIAELEAGKALIQADQVNEGLVKRTLVPPLLWAAKKADEGAGLAIKLAITKIFDLLT